MLLVEVDRLSRQAQAALRRTMEKYTASCRLILCCNNPSKVIDPLRSRCLGVRVPAPSHAEIADVLQGVARKENLVLPPELAARIAHASDRNLRRATLMLQASHARQYPFSADQQVELPDWKIGDIVAKNTGLNPGTPGVFLNPSVNPDDESLKLLLPEEE